MENEREVKESNNMVNGKCIVNLNTNKRKNSGFNRSRKYEDLS